jgi:hypothetical protein
MTRRVARTVANLVVVSAGVAAAYVVYTTPPLRRLAAVAARRWLGASIPMFLLIQVRQAWIEAGAARAPGRRARLGAEGPVRPVIVIPGDESALSAAAWRSLRA